MIIYTYIYIYTCVNGVLGIPLGFEKFLFLGFCKVPNSVLLQRISFTYVALNFKKILNICLDIFNGYSMNIYFIFTICIYSNLIQIYLFYDLFIFKYNI